MGGLVSEPAGHTPAGTPYYAPGRFDDDPAFLERCAELRRRHGLEHRGTELEGKSPHVKLMATREFAART